MKFGTVGQLGPLGKITLVSALALVAATLFTACGTLNVGFLFVATTKQTPGQIEVYEVNSEAGNLKVIPTSPFPSGGRNPVAMTTSPDFKNLYTANQDDNNIVQLGIGTDGKLYPQSTSNTPGAFPVAVAVDASGSFLYALDTLGPKPGCTLSDPCPGTLTAFPITPDSSKTNPGALGNPILNADGLDYVPLQLTPSDATTILTPTALALSPNKTALYVTAYNANTTPNRGYLFAFQLSSTGAIAALNGGLPIPAGVQPVAITSDSSSGFLYVVDKGSNHVFTYAVQSSGLPTLQATANTGNQPSSLTLFGDKYLYVANSTDSTVTAYSIAGGNLTRISTNASDDNPVAITVDPRHFGYLYTVNFLAGTLSGYQIQSDGTLINTKHSPYPSNVQPVAIAGIPHGGTVK